MKKFYILLLLLALSPALSALAQEYGWTDISANMPEQGNLNDIHVIGDEVWITGWGDGVFYSPDSGETFQILALPENSGISSSVFMKNNQEGYVVTYSGNILKTDDGGTNWTILHEPGGALNSVHFPPNSETGYTCGSNGTVWSFDDTSITDISPSGVATNLQSIYFPEDNNDGKVCGQTTIRRYKNNSWENLQFYDGTLNYNSIFFIDNNLGWSCGINGTIIRTINGSHWEIMESNTTIENFNDVFFINPFEGWAAGTDVLLHSVDGGETWTEELESQTVGKELRAIYFTSANNGYVVGNGTVLKYGIISGEENNDATLSSIQINSEELSGFNAATLNYQVELPTGTTTVPTVAATPNDANATVVITQAAEIPGTSTILVSAEDGVTQQTYTVEFTATQNTGWVDISANIPGTPNLSDVFFVSDDEGWITSSSIAEIYHTTDGGATFEVQTTQYTCNAIHMLNANEGYAGGAQGRVYRTTDGGENWNAIGSMGATLADISFPPNGDTGYCCGINGNIHAITSSDVTKMTSNINGDLSSISFPVNSEEGWVCGGDVIRHYANDTWNGDQDYPSGGYNAIYMLDSLNGWAVGDGGIIIHTTDGQNWFEQENQKENSLFAVNFLDLKNGRAIGSGGTIVHTNNGGENWIVEGAGITSYSFTGVHFTSPTNGYVVGNGKTLLKYTELPTGVGQELEALKFEIFPNPAAGKFSVQCSIVKVENTTIELYDLTGKKLLEKPFPAGTENVEIDVSHLKNGVYFCRLTSEKYSAIQKLIIQK